MILPWPQFVQRARQPFAGLLRTSVVAAFVAPRNVDDYLELADPLWSVHEIRARIVAIRRETADTVSVVLSPNERWPGHRAGQFVLLTAWIEGVRTTRTFSISSAPEDGPHLRLTMRVFPGGRVGSWVQRNARAGDVVRLSAPMGDFVLPEPLPQKLLFVSGGSGITPIMAMLRYLAARSYEGDVTCLHYARDEVVFDRELDEVAARLTRVKMLRTLTRGSRGEKGLGAARLATVVPDWREREAYVCGPTTLLDAAGRLWADHGASARLHVERFTARVDEGGPAASKLGPGSERLVTFARSGRVLTGRADEPLLLQAEKAGIRAPHGCRMGICHTCTCRKTSGVVRNVVTGQLHDAPDEDIRICVSAPVSDVTLDL